MQEDIQPTDLATNRERGSWQSVSKVKEVFLRRCTSTGGIVEEEKRECGVPRRSARIAWYTLILPRCSHFVVAYAWAVLATDRVAVRSKARDCKQI